MTSSALDQPNDGRSGLSRLVRSGLIVMGLAGLVLAAGFFWQQPWASGLLPWPIGRLSAIFIASILAASAVPVLWIGWSGELAAIAAGAIDLCVSYAGIAVFSFQAYAAGPQPPILIFALVSAGLSLVSAGLFLWTRRLAFRDGRRVPMPVRLSFGLFIVILVAVGGALVLKRANIFPWRLTPEQSVLYGWIFLGAACYFLAALTRPSWGNAKGQLMGFLAYDLVLIVPFARHFESVEPALRVNLAVYTAVLVFSAALAVYYLLRDRAI